MPGDLVAGHERKSGDPVVIVDGLDVTVADATVSDGNSDLMVLQFR
jgi:gentisate 1,2-dioxygenase